MAEQEAEAGADKYKGHKRPHELIPDYIKDRGKIDVGVQLSECTWYMHFSHVLMLHWPRATTTAGDPATVEYCLGLTSGMQHTPVPLATPC
jgi:hypothetical protein